MVEEQVFVAALDCNKIEIAEECLQSLSLQFVSSLRVAKLKGMRLEALERLPFDIVELNCFTISIHDRATII